MTEIHRRLSIALPRLRSSDDPMDQVHYARDLWPRRHLAVRSGEPAPERPGAIAWPSNAEEVQALVRWAREEGVSLVPFGAGSGVCAAVRPDARTVVVDMKRMARILCVDPVAPRVEVEAGHLGVSLERELERRGFTVGHFPSSILCSTAGGWVATRSGGQCSGAYGKIEDMTAALECVDGRGALRTLRRRASGPDLVPLVVGSEGTCGIVTRATFRLHPAPATRGFGAWTFASTSAGLDAMRAVFQSGLRPAVARLYDPFDAMLARRGGHPRPAGSTYDRPAPERRPGLGAVALRAMLRSPEAVNDLLHSRLAARALGGAMLVVVFEGTGDACRAGVDAARSVVERSRGSWIGEGPARRWLDHRYSVSFRQSGIFARGAFVDTMEVAAPWSRLEAVYDGVRRALGRHVFVMAHFSHAYPDGCCIYFSFVGAADTGRLKSEDWDGACGAAYDAAWTAGLSAAIEAGAAVSHHHGIGRSKAAWLAAELGEATGVVGSVLEAFDPDGILNPGALVERGSIAATSGAGVARAEERAGVKTSTALASLDERSLLVRAGGSDRVSALEAMLRDRGLTLGLTAAAPDESVASWLAGGAPGARDPWADPADHVLAGVGGRLHDGRSVVLRPAPRRAVGPDLSALFVGAGERFGRIDYAWLRVHRAAEHRPSSAPFAHDRDPPLDAGEEELLGHLGRALARGAHDAGGD